MKGWLKRRESRHVTAAHVDPRLNCEHDFQWEREENGRDIEACSQCRRVRAMTLPGVTADRRAEIEREQLREEGRTQVVRALLRGELQIVHPMTGEACPVSPPWTEGDPRHLGVPLDQIIRMTLAPPE